MTLSAYFMSKSVFDAQGCRALTLALARLSCYFGSNNCQFCGMIFKRIVPDEYLPGIFY